MGDTKPNAASFDFVDTDEDSGATYRPWTDGWAVGFKAEHPDGRVAFIYLNPSGGSDDGVPNVFLYCGPTGDSAQDPPYHHYDLFDPDEVQASDKPAGTPNE
jgi:hypothetical protein